MYDNLIEGEIALIEFIKELCGEDYVNVSHIDKEFKSQGRTLGSPSCFYKEMKFINEDILTLFVGEVDIYAPFGIVCDNLKYKFSIYYVKGGFPHSSFKYLRKECVYEIYDIFTLGVDIVEKRNTLRQKQAEDELSKKLYEHNNENLLSFVNNLREGK